MVAVLLHSPSDDEYPELSTPPWSFSRRRLPRPESTPGEGLRLWARLRPRTGPGVRAGDSMGRWVGAGVELGDAHMVCLRWASLRAGAMPGGGGGREGEE